MSRLVVKEPMFSVEGVNLTYEIANYSSYNTIGLKLESAPLTSLEDLNNFMFYNFQVVCWPFGKDSNDRGCLSLGIIFENCTNLTGNIKVIYRSISQTDQNINLSGEKYYEITKITTRQDHHNYPPMGYGNYNSSDTLSIHLKFQKPFLSINEPLHQEILSKALENLIEDKDSCDVNIVVNKKNIPAHRCILSARSPVFKAMLNSKMKEDLNKEIPIDDLSESTVREMIFYLYTGKSPNLSNVAEELVVAAEKYSLDLLKESCEIQLLKNLEIKNACSLFILADLYSLKNLKTACSFLICKNLNSVLKSNDFDELFFPRPNLMKELLFKLAS